MLTTLEMIAYGLLVAGQRHPHGLWLLRHLSHHPARAAWPPARQNLINTGVTTLIQIGLP